MSDPLTGLADRQDALPRDSTTPVDKATAPSVCHCLSRPQPCTSHLAPAVGRPIPKDRTGARRHTRTLTRQDIGDGNMNGQNNIMLL